MSRRETIFAALFANLTGLVTATTLKEASRRLVNVADWNVEQTPSAYQLQGEQVVRKQVRLPPVIEMHCHWVVYAGSTDPAVPPSTALNTAVDAVIATLNPNPPDDVSNTLGGLVTDCAVEGNIEIFEGLLGDKAVALIPIKITAPWF